VADVAHDLGNAMGVISLQVGALTRTASCEEWNDTQRRLALAMKLAQRLLAQLLDLARLDTSACGESAPFDVAELARDVLMLHSLEADLHQVTLAYEGPESLEFDGIGHALEAVITNLVLNAIRHGVPGGNATLRIGHHGSRLQHVSVLDDGPGICAAERRRLFDRFARGRDAADNGHGLGMAIVKSASERLGASVRLSEGLGGTGLSVTLTFSQPANLSTQTTDGALDSGDVY